MRISLSAAWDETKAILARDGRLFAAVALALLVLPGILFDVSKPEAPAGEMPPAGPWMILAALALVISLAGQLAIIRLALGGGTSVREAISHGLRRLLPYIAAILLWTVPLAIVAGALYSATGIDTETPRGGPALGFLLIVGFGLFLVVRLIFSSSVASAEPIGPLAILKRSWGLSRGNWWRLFAFAALFGVTLLVVLTAVGGVLGSIVAAAFGGLKPWSVGTLLVSLATQLISAAASVVLFVMLARLYRQAAGGDTSESGVPRTGM